MTVVWHERQALERDAEGGTALHSAAGDGKTMVVSALLDAGVDVGMGHGGWTALHEVRLPPAMSHRAGLQQACTESAGLSLNAKQRRRKLSLTRLSWTASREQRQVLAC